jgi:hypothetical protein
MWICVRHTVCRGREATIPSASHASSNFAGEALLGFASVFNLQIYRVSNEPNTAA